jgi:hypothetical protein
MQIRTTYKEISSTFGTSAHFVMVPEQITQSVRNLGMMCINHYRNKKNPFTVTKETTGLWFEAPLGS